MSFTVAELADALGFACVGDGAMRIDGLAEPGSATDRDLALASNPKYAQDLSLGSAKAALLWPDADWQAFGLDAAILATRPRFAMSRLTQMFDPGQGFDQGIHPSAAIDPTAQIGADVSVGAFSVIGRHAVIGAGSILGPQVFVGAEAQIGAGAYLREQVTIGARTRVGTGFVAQPGGRIGGDGFSFVTPDKSGAEAARESMGDQQDTAAQSWHRIHSLGGVWIGDAVEVGANAAIDAGTIRATRIGDGTKIDNLVQIGHNAIIGQDCLICGQAGIAGSAVLGNNVVLGGKAGVVDNITVGDRVVAAAGSLLSSNVPAGRVMMGSPATQMDTQIESYKALRRLPRRLADLDAIKKAVFKSTDSD